MGEDIGVYGGAFKVTDGMLEALVTQGLSIHPSRRRDCWAGVGAAHGAQTGAEIQFLDFLSCGFDMLTNLLPSVIIDGGRPYRS